VPDLGLLSALGDLQHHWGSAYAIACPEPGIWLAQRRDTDRTLRAGDAEELRMAIRADYESRPVPRLIAAGQ
jgi:hypothetical protein